jgi:hypothetical protein
MKQIRISRESRAIIAARSSASAVEQKKALHDFMRLMRREPRCEYNGPYCAWRLTGYTGRRPT